MWPAARKKSKRRFEATYRIVRARIEAFLALPLAQLASDRAGFKLALDRIGTLDA
jgi:arsenate reductase